MTEITLTTDMQPDGIHVFHGKQKIALIKPGKVPLTEGTWTILAELNDPIQSRLLNTPYRSLKAAEYCILAYAYELREAFNKISKIDPDDLDGGITFEVTATEELVICKDDDGRYRVDMLTDDGTTVHWSLYFSEPQYAWTEWKRWVK